MAQTDLAQAGSSQKLTTEARKAALDRLKGWADAPGRDPGMNASHRVTVSVERPDGMTVDAETHVAGPMDDPGQPSSGYLMVFARAAEELQFPPEYVAMLRDFAARPLAA